MSAQRLQMPAGSGFPETDAAVLSSRSPHSTAWGEGYGVDGSTIATQHGQLPASGDVPQTNGPVVVPGRKGGAIGGKGHGLRSSRPAQCSLQLTCGEVPQPDGPFPIY